MNVLAQVCLQDVLKITHLSLKRQMVHPFVQTGVPPIIVRPGVPSTNHASILACHVFSYGKKERLRDEHEKRLYQIALKSKCKERIFANFRRNLMVQSQCIIQLFSWVIFLISPANILVPKHTCTKPLHKKFGCVQRPE